MGAKAVILLALVLGIGATRLAHADGGATAAALVYLKAEAVNIARQAGDWTISHGPYVEPNGNYGVTFKNVVRYGPGGIGKQSTWIEIKGNFATGPLDVEGRGGPHARAIARWFNGQFKALAANINWPRPPGMPTERPSVPGVERLYRMAVLPSGGRVTPQPDGTWIERGQNGQFVCRFRQVHRDARCVVLREDNRRFLLTLPLAGGQILWQYDGQQAGPWGTVRWE